jgi:hypothetical protein
MRMGLETNDKGWRHEQLYYVVEAKSPATGIVGAADRFVGDLGEVQSLRGHQEERCQGKLRHRGHIRC